MKINKNDDKDLEQRKIKKFDFNEITKKLTKEEQIDFSLLLQKSLKHDKLKIENFNTESCIEIAKFILTRIVKSINKDVNFAFDYKKNLWTIFSDE